MKSKPSSENLDKKEAQQDKTKTEEEISEAARMDQ